MPEFPSVIGRYQTLDMLGRGGMGVVYLARDPALSRIVVIKVMQVDAPVFRRRFLREARAAGCLNHDAIVTIFDAGEFEGRLFIVMEYVEGRTVGQIIKRAEEWPLRRRLRLMRDLCDGLAYAHAQGIVHRDVKPDNLMVRDASGALAILDFGIARLAEASTTSGIDDVHTPVGEMIGTPHYMAPEQIRGEAVDHRCDIFSVGAVFYELLSYRRAFSADTLTGVIYKILHEEPPPLDAALNPGVISIVERAMAKDPAARYQDLQEVCTDIDAVILGIEGDGDETILQPSAYRRDRGGAGGGEASSATGVSTAGASTADAKPAPEIGESNGGASARRQHRGGPGFPEGFAARRAVVRAVGVLAGVALLAAVGVWLASSSGGESGPGASVSAQSAPPRDPGVDDRGAADGAGATPEVEGGAAAEDSGAVPVTETPERDVDELLTEANRAFGEGRYVVARRLFREVREISGGEALPQANGAVSAERATVDR